MSRLTTRDVESKVLSDLAQASKNKILDNDIKVRSKRFKIHELSHRDNNLLCRELEEVLETDPEFWKKLAEHMGLSTNKIQV